jgi:hypothetical protein
MEGIRNCIQKTVQEQASQYQQGMLEYLAHRKEKQEVLRREEILLPVKCIRRRLGPHINLPIHRRMHEQGRFMMGKGAKSNDTLEAPK